MSAKSAQRCRTCHRVRFCESIQPPAYRADSERHPAARSDWFHKRRTDKEQTNLARLVRPKFCRTPPGTRAEAQRVCGELRGRRSGTRASAAGTLRQPTARKLSLRHSESEVRRTPMGVPSHSGA
jgi:hypothetical protein